MVPEELNSRYTELVVDIFVRLSILEIEINIKVGVQKCRVRLIIIKL